MNGKLSAFDYFHLAVGSAPTTTPRHDIGATVNQTAIKALFQKCPDRVIVFLGHGEVAASFIRRLGPVFFFVPIHPIA